jgi:hypothetical protein
MTQRSKRKGKRGEKGARLLLEEAGWYIAATEIQGLAGDDLFARDPEGKWWSVEVKNTTAFHSKFIAQARRQASERMYAIQRKGKENPTDAEVIEFLGMSSFTPSDWLVLWHPSNANARSSLWVAVRKGKDDTQYTEFISPFTGKE